MSEKGNGRERLPGQWTERGLEAAGFRREPDDQGRNLWRGTKPRDPTREVVLELLGVEVYEVASASKEDFQPAAGQRILDLNAADKDEEIRVAEKTDEALIEAELRGEVLDLMAYRSRDGKTTLSWAGVKHLAWMAEQRGNPLSIERIEYLEDKGEYYQCLVWAKNLKTGTMRPGISTQMKKTTVRGQTVDDEFAIQKVLSKAQRNALRALIPEVEAAEIIADWTDAKKPIIARQREGI